MLPIEEINKKINFLNLDPRIKEKFKAIHTTAYTGLQAMRDLAPEIKTEIWDLLVTQYLGFAVMFCNNAEDCRSEHLRNLEQAQLTKDVTNQFAEIKNRPEWAMKYGGGKYQLQWHGRPFFRALEANEIAQFIPIAIKQMEGQPAPVVEVNTTLPPETVETVTTTPEPEPSEVTTTADPGDQNPPVDEITTTTTTLPPNPVSEAAAAMLDSGATLTTPPPAPPAP